MLARARCPGLACGALQTFFEEIADLASGDLVLRRCARVPDQDRAQLVANFELGKQVLGGWE